MDHSEEQDEDELITVVEEGEIEPRARMPLREPGWPKGSKGKTQVTPRNKATKASEVVESESTAIVPKEISDQIRLWQTIRLSMDDSKEISKNYSLDFEDQSFSFEARQFYVDKRQRPRLKGVCATKKAHVSTQLKDMRRHLLIFIAKYASWGGRRGDAG